MPAACMNLLIEQGATFRARLTVRNKATGAVVDLTGYQVRMQFRQEVVSTTPLLDLDNATKGGITVTPLGGQIDILVTATQTAALTVSSAVYDMEIESPLGEVWRIIQGRAEISKEVTRV